MPVVPAQDALRSRPGASAVSVPGRGQRLIILGSTGSIGVNTLNVRGKARRQRTAQAGRDENWKKAIVTLNEEDKIEFF